jgi:hypothetical protein
MVTPKARAKHEHLFNEVASEQKLMPSCSLRGGFVEHVSCT